MSDGILRIYINDNNLLIHNLLKSKLIQIEKTFCSIEHKDISMLNTINIQRVIKTFGIIGILKVGVDEFLSFITSAEKVGNIGSTEIFEVKEVDFILISSDQKGSKENIPNEIVSIIKNIKNMLTQGFYFSQNYDLTNSLQVQKLIKINNHNKYNFIKDANPEYLWNYELYSKFFEYNIDCDFMINLIYGYVGSTFQILEDKTRIDYILISRRSTKNTGAQNFKRGINQSGDVANLIETEQIVIVQQNVFSYVQVRSDPPVFYSSQSHPTPNIFARHMNKLLEKQNYKLIFMINLMNSLNENEQILTEKLEQLIQKFNIKNLKYSYFDYDKENTGKRSSVSYQSDLIDMIGFLSNKTCNININEVSYPEFKEDFVLKLLNKLESIFSIFKFFGIYYTNKENLGSPTKVMDDQIGVIETINNEGFEKSNVIQMRISWIVLINQLKCININDQHFGNNFMGNNDSNDLLNLNGIGVGSGEKYDLIKNFKKLWSLNGEKLKMQNFDQDYYDSTEDTIKQRCFDLLLNKYNLNIGLINDNIIENELNLNSEKFTQSEELTVFIASWNVGGANVKEELSLYEWLNPKNKLKKTPDIYCIGLQEIVELNAKHILLSTNQPKVEYWKNNIKLNLEAIDEYFFILFLVIL